MPHSKKKDCYGRLKKTVSNKALLKMKIKTKQDNDEKNK